LSLDIVQSDERQDEEKLLVQDIITLGKHYYAQGFRDFEGWKNQMLDQLGSRQILPYVARVWPEVSGEPAPLGDPQRGQTVREPMDGASRESTSAKHHSPYRAICRRCHAEFSFPGGTTGSYCETCQAQLFGTAPPAAWGWEPILIRGDRWGRWIRHFQRGNDPRTACGRWNIDVDSTPDTPGFPGDVINCRRCVLAFERDA
jgi:hypothetical protein